MYLKVQFFADTLAAGHEACWISHRPSGSQLIGVVCFHTKLAHVLLRHGTVTAKCLSSLAMFGNPHNQAIREMLSASYLARLE